MPPPRPPVLIDELVEEILLHLPPNNPVPLFRTALVCKNWCRLIAGSGFRRRYQDRLDREKFLYVLLHLPAAARQHSTRLGCSRHPPKSSLIEPEREDLLVWNPITGEGQRLPELHGAWTAALICATAGCNHLNCDNGPQTVTQPMSVSTHRRKMCGASRASRYLLKHYQRNFYTIRGPAHVGNAVFSKFIAINVPVDLEVKKRTGILAYDQHKLELSLLSVPSSCERSRYRLMATEDGNIGFTMRKVAIGHNDESRVIELDNLIPGHNGRQTGWMFSPYVFAVSDRQEIVFLMTVDKILLVDLKSGRVVNYYEQSQQVKKRKWSHFQ
ncbi:hypothetical protein EJB05_40825, partial [Eragrostis curvula]